MPVKPAARFQVDPVCYRPPGVCFICHSGANGPFIRSGLTHDYYKEAPDASRDGDVYFCQACVKEMAETLEITSDVDHQLEEARKQGVLDGVLLAGRNLSGYSADFVDACLGYSSGGSVDIFDEDTAPDADSEQPDSEATDSGDKQGPVVDSGEGCSDLSGD